MEDLQRVLKTDRFCPARVEATSRLTPNMYRITLYSEIVKSFAENCPGAHLKLIVPDRLDSRSSFVELIGSGNFKKQMRTYTIRHANPQTVTIDVDIVAHGDIGRVGAWAQIARPGDTIVISICGDPKLITEGVHRIVAATDLTGFPALAAGLVTLHTIKSVQAFVEIPSEDDRQPFDAPQGVNINWIIKPDPFAPSTEMINATKALEKPDDQTSVFVAAEFSTVANLRQYFQKQLKTSKALTYISSYWKAGLNEPEHKVVKASAA